MPRFCLDSVLLFGFVGCCRYNYDIYQMSTAGPPCTATDLVIRGINLDTVANCLAFFQIPEDATICLMGSGQSRECASCLAGQVPGGGDCGVLPDTLLRIQTQIPILREESNSRLVCYETDDRRIDAFRDALASACLVDYATANPENIRDCLLDNAQHLRKGCAACIATHYPHIHEHCSVGIWTENDLLWTTSTLLEERERASVAVASVAAAEANSDREIGAIAMRDPANSLSDVD